MDYNQIKISVEEEIATITINREKALNALNKELMQELDDFFRTTLKKPYQYKGIILTGSGNKAFAAGADIKELIQLSKEEGKALSKFGHDLFDLIDNYPIPVVAAVNGFCLGGGCELAMACHLRIASPNARFGQPEVNLGIVTGYGGSQRLIQLIGKGKALELLMTADIIKAEAALYLGLVNHIVAMEELLPKANEIIEKIAQKGPQSITKIIDCVNAYYEKSKNGFNTEIEHFGSMFQTEEFLEGAGAFIEKRKANFKK
ncbi:MAG: enoyl-CoA hydratase-related protein [Bacteroidota bacterium]